VHDDDFVVTGQKIWTSYADEADWIFCLVRTDSAKKHTGISFLLIDMTSAGVSTKPIQLISGKSPFCETFFDGVKVPRANLVGELNAGWTIAKYLLTHERDMISAIGERAAPRPVGRHAAERLGRDENGRLNDPGAAQRDRALRGRRGGVPRLAQVGRRAGACARGTPGAVVGAQVLRCRAEQAALGTDDGGRGADALEWEGERSSAGTAARTWLRTKANSIEGGTSEVQLNVVSKRLLGLPGA
jgi:alkylation response protein AidB-like acyl-CoA dehydrogenase